MKANPVVHFEMPYKDGSRAAEFYKTAFNWKITDTGKKMGNYLLATTTDTDEKGMVKSPGAINGGFYPLEAAKDSKEPSIVIAVDDLEVSMKKVKDAGGKLLGAPVDIPGVGRYVSFVDPEGNRASLLQPAI